MHSFPCMPTSSNATCVLLCFLFLFFCGGRPQVLSSSVTTEASFSPHVLHVTSSISRNVNKHNEPAGQGTVAPLCRWIRTQTHRLHSSAQTTWKNIRQEKRGGGGERETATHGRQKDWEREPGCQIGKHLSSISVTTASLTASVAMTTEDCQASWREGWSKKSAAVTYFRREEKWS